MDACAAARFAIVKGLAIACTCTHLLQRLPITGNYAYCVLAGWSADLEDRWETGAWTKSPPPGD